MPGYRVNLADRDQVGGGVMLLVKSSARHDQLVLPHVVNLETTAVRLYLQNNFRVLFISCDNPPTPLFCTLTPTAFFPRYILLV